MKVQISSVFLMAGLILAGFNQAQAQEANVARNVPATSEVREHFFVAPAPTTLELSIPAGAAVGTDATSSAPSAAAGIVIGLQAEISDIFYFNGVINVGGATGTLSGQSQLGSFILDPSGMQLSAALSTFLYPWHGGWFGGLIPWQLGFAAGVGGGTATWEGATQSAQASVLYVIAGVQGQLGTWSAAGNTFSLGAEVGGGIRLLLGDVTLSSNDAFRTAVLGTADKYFGEFLTAIFIQVNQITGYIRLTVIPSSTPVDGLSSAQLSFGVKLQTKALKYDITVPKGNVKVTDIELDLPAVTVKVGKSVQLTASVHPDNASDRAVTWLSDTPTVAIVDDSGNVTGVAVGTAKITVKTADGGKTADCTVTVAAGT